MADLPTQSLHTIQEALKYFFQNTLVPTLNFKSCTCIEQYNISFFKIMYIFLLNLTSILAMESVHDYNFLISNFLFQLGKNWYFNNLMHCTMSSYFTECQAKFPMEERRDLPSLKEIETEKGDKINRRDQQISGQKWSTSGPDCQNSSVQKIGEKIITWT